MRQSLSKRLMLALAAPLTLILVVVAQAAPAAQEAAPAQGPGNPARVAIVHAAPFDLDGGTYERSGTAVTVTATRGSETALLQQNMVFGNVVPYLSLASGDYQLKVFAGSRSLSETLTLTPALTASVSLAADSDYTVLATGRADATYPLGLRVFQDTPAAAGANQGQLRLIHAAPFSPPPGGVAGTSVRIVDVGPDPDVVLVPTLIYSNTTNFIPFNAGVYTPTLLSNINDAVIVAPTTLPIAAGDLTTLIAAGDGVNEPPTILSLPLSDRGDALLRLVHAAPFAPGNATASIVIDPDFIATGNLPVPGVNFKGKTLYRPIGPGTYTVKVYAGSVITGTPVLTQSFRLFDGDAVTAVVIGTNTVTYPLDLEYLVDRRTPAGSATADVRFFHAAPFASAPAGTGVDVIGQTDPPGTPPLITDLVYREVSSYLTVQSGQEIDLRVVRTGTTTDVLPVPPVTFTAGSVQTIIAVGDGVNQTPDLLVLNDLQQTSLTYIPLVGTPPR